MAFKGRLKIRTLKADTYVPIEKAKITVMPSTDTTAIREMRQTVITDNSGLTEDIELDTPSIENSMNPTDKLPYSLYDLKVEAAGFEPVFIKGCQVFPNVTAIQEVAFKEVGTRQGEEIINIEPNTLVGKYPPKIPENPEKVLPPPPSGFVVLPEPVVPQYIVVHTGVPDDNSAPNYTVRYSDYIKNVASSEIFSTWPENTIRANVYCIISFTLNRIYTEWYRGKGKDFDITNSTAYDHAFSFGRNIYDNISRIVDNIFSTYIKRSAREQPLLTQYCDGVKVQCPGWLTQWGSKYLGDEGKTPYEILTNFYGPNLDLTTAKKVSGIPRSYPGYTLSQGSTGMPVRTIQTYLNRISLNYPAVPKVIVDGIYGSGTINSVKTFQQIFGLWASGNVDYATWYKISDVYVGVTKIAELRGHREENSSLIFVPPVPYVIQKMGAPVITIPSEYE